MSLLAIAVATLLQTAPAVAATPTPAPTPTPTIAAARRPRMICRAQGRVTGSLLAAPRVCHTAEDWRFIDRENHDNADAMRDQMGRGVAR